MEWTNDLRNNTKARNFNLVLNNSSRLQLKEKDSTNLKTSRVNSNLSNFLFEDEDDTHSPPTGVIFNHRSPKFIISSLNLISGQTLVASANVILLVSEGGTIKLI